MSDKIVEKVLFPEQGYAIQGAVLDVYREMGCGYLETVYHECLEKEFAAHQVPFEAHKELDLFYKGKRLGQTFKPDFICFNHIMVVVKAVKQIGPEHQAQLLSYLKATGFELGLLLNFGGSLKAEIVQINHSNLLDFRAFRG